VDSAEGADAHLHRHYDDENHPKSRFTPLTGLIQSEWVLVEDPELNESLEVKAARSSGTARTGKNLAASM